VFYPQKIFFRVYGWRCFDAIDDYINVNHNTALNPASVSFEIWAITPPLGLISPKTQALLDKTGSGVFAYGLC